MSFLRAILRILFFGAWVNDLQSLTPSTLARLLSEPDAERSEVEMIKYVRPARHRGHVLDLPGKQTMRASCRPSSAKERCTLQEHVYSKYLHLIGVVDVSISKQSSENRIAQQGSGTEKVPHHTNNDHSGFTLNLGQPSMTSSSQPWTPARSSEHLSAFQQQARNILGIIAKDFNQSF